MKEITLAVEDKQFDTLLHFLKTLDYVKVSDGIFTLRDFKRSLAEVKLMREGKLPKRPIEQLLNEL